MNDAPSVPPVPSTSKNSPLAIWSLVLGILSLTLCSLFAGIPAVICGHMACGRIKRSGGLLAGQGLALAGLITGYISIALAVVMVPMMLAIAVPNFVKARESAQKNVCISNLRQLNGAIEAFALEKKKQSTDPVTLNDLTPYLKRTLVCPAGGTSIQDSYRVTDCQSLPTCISPGGGAAHGHVLDR
jgi:competence protein ComGC